MQATRFSIPDLILFTPKVFGDDRGFFFESFNQEIFEQLTGLKPNFVQDNHSKSQKGVLREIHIINCRRRRKANWCELFRVKCLTLLSIFAKTRQPLGNGRCNTIGGKQQQFWIPAGFAHGFLTLSDSAEFLYKTTDYYAPEYERCIAWNEDSISIQWPLVEAPILSGKDQQGKNLAESELFA